MVHPSNFDKVVSLLGVFSFILEGLFREQPALAQSFPMKIESEERPSLPFVESLSKYPKHGLHNPFKSPERFVFIISYCGLPVDDVDFIISDGKTMNKLLLKWPTTYGLCFCLTFL